MFQWAGFDPSVVMAPHYSFPVSVVVPPGPIPLTHHSSQFPVLEIRILVPFQTPVQLLFNIQLQQILKLRSSQHNSRPLPIIQASKTQEMKYLDRQNGNDV